MDHAPTVQNYLILGDALLSIQEPADAIIAFQQAMDIDSHKETNEMGLAPRDPPYRKKRRVISL